MGAKSTKQSQKPFEMDDLSSMAETIERFNPEVKETLHPNKILTKQVVKNFLEKFGIATEEKTFAWFFKTFSQMAETGNRSLFIFQKNNIVIPTCITLLHKANMMTLFSPDELAKIRKSINKEIESLLSLC